MEELNFNFCHLFLASNNPLLVVWPDFSGFPAAQLNILKFSITHVSATIMRALRHLNVLRFNVSQWKSRKTLNRDN